jgi:hypothetical protein
VLICGLAGLFFFMTKDHALSGLEAKLTTELSNFSKESNLAVIFSTRERG